MKDQSAYCPACGAPLDVPAEATEVTCASCGTTSLVETLDPGDGDESAIAIDAPTRPKKRKMSTSGCVTGVVMWFLGFTFLAGLLSQVMGDRGLIVAFVVCAALGLWLYWQRTKATP